MMGVVGIHSVRKPLETTVRQRRDDIRKRGSDPVDGMPAPQRNLDGGAGVLAVVRRERREHGGERRKLRQGLYLYNVLRVAARRVETGAVRRLVREVVGMVVVAVRDDEGPCMVERERAVALVRLYDKRT